MITKLVVNKCDILREVGAWGLITDSEVTHFDSEADFNKAITKMANGFGVEDKNIYFSESPEKI